MLLPLNWTWPAEKRNFRHSLSDTWGNQCHEPSQGGLQCVGSGSCCGDGTGSDGDIWRRGSHSSLGCRETSASFCPSCGFWHEKGAGVKTRASSLFSMFSRGSCGSAPGPKPTGTFRTLQREITFIKSFRSFPVCSKYTGQWFHCTVQLPGLKRQEHYWASKTITIIKPPKFFPIVWTCQKIQEIHGKMDGFFTLADPVRLIHLLRSPVASSIYAKYSLTKYLKVLKKSKFSTCRASTYNKVSHVADVIGMIFCSILRLFTYLKFSNSDPCARNM